MSWLLLVMTGRAATLLPRAVQAPPPSIRRHSRPYWERSLPLPRRCKHPGGVGNVPSLFLEDPHVAEDGFGAAGGVSAYQEADEAGGVGGIEEVEHDQLLVDVEAEV